MKEAFTYNSVPPDMVTTIIDSYIKLGSYLLVSLSPQVACSPSTVARVIDAAVEHGIIHSDQINPPHRPKIDRDQVLSVKHRHPSATNAQIAALAGCSQATLYRILKEANHET